MAWAGVWAPSKCSSTAKSFLRKRIGDCTPYPAFTHMFELASKLSLPPIFVQRTQSPFSNHFSTMTTKSRLALLSTLASTPLFAAPFLAIGDNAELFLTARVEARYEDNVTFSEDNISIEDEVLEFVPGFDVVFGKNSLVKGSFSVYERFLKYSDNSAFDEELFNAVFGANYDGAKLKSNVNASFKELNQNSRDANLDGRLVRSDATNAGARGELSVTEKSKVAAGVNYSKTDYKVGGFTDREAYTVPVNYYFAISEKVDLSAGVQYRVNDSAASGADSDEVFYNVGARGEFTPKLSGNFSVGYATRDPEVGDNNDTVGVDAGFVYAYSPKTQFTLNLGNDFQSSSNGTGQEVASIGAGVRSALTSRVTATANLGYQMIEYLGTNREDDYVTGSLGVVYGVNQHLSLEAFYNYIDNSTNALGSEFTANIITIAASLRY